MTGKGTENSPYIVDNWTDFVNAVGTENAYVKLITDIDMNNIDLSETVFWRAIEVDGCQRSIYNIRAIGHEKRIFGTGNTRVVIKNLNFIDVYSDVLYFWRGLFSFVNSIHTGKILWGTYFAGASPNTTIYLASSPETKGCLCEFSMEGGRLITHGSEQNVQFTDTRLKITNTYGVFDGTGSFTMNNCLFEGDFYSQETYVSGSYNAFSVNIPQNHFLRRYSGQENIINSDLIEGSTTLTALTTEQMCDKSYLKSIGFINDSNNWDIINKKLTSNKFPEWTGIRNKPVKQREYIIVFDMDTKQNEFNTNGLAVLSPTSAVITEVLNGEWYLELEHPVDPEGKYKYILEKNIIKAMGQLFTIERVVENWNGNSGSVSCYAEHIFYQLNDPWIYPDTRITGNTAYTVINNAYHTMARNTEQGQAYYEYRYSGDADIPAGAASNQWNPIKDGCTLVEVILGSSGIIAIAGGKLYRDNFYFSVNKKMENSKENAFDIRIGLNLSGIKRTVDTSEMCFFLMGYDSYGSQFGVSWVYESMPRAFPHSIIRSKNFSFDIDEDTLPNNWTEQDKIDKSAELLESNTLAWFNSHCAPVVSYEIDIEDIANNPDIQELSGQFEYKVGNTGRIYDTRIGEPVILEITKTVKDAIRGVTTQVCFGDLQSFTRPASYNSAIESLESVAVGTYLQLRDKSGNKIFDSDKNGIMQKMR